MECLPSLLVSKYAYLSLVKLSIAFFVNYLEYPYRHIYLKYVWDIIDKYVRTIAIEHTLSFKDVSMCNVNPTLRKSLRKHYFKVYNYKETYVKHIFISFCFWSQCPIVYTGDCLCIKWGVYIVLSLTNSVYSVLMLRIQFDALTYRYSKALFCI